MMKDLYKRYHADINFAHMVNEVTKLMEWARWSESAEHAEQRWRDAVKLAEHMHDTNEKANL
jgi:hypothetical protein